MKELHPFVASLYALAKNEDRAALAELRRSWTSPLAAMPYVARYLRRDAGPWEERALSLVGGLFALHPEPGGRTLAQALRLLSEQSDSVALRFRALLDSEPEDLGVHLRHAVTLVRSQEIGIDYDDLLRKVQRWGHPLKHAQRSWARDFWGYAEDDSQAKETTP